MKKKYPLMATVKSDNFKKQQMQCFKNCVPVFTDDEIIINIARLAEKHKKEKTKINLNYFSEMQFATGFAEKGRYKAVEWMFALANDFGMITTAVARAVKMFDQILSKQMNYPLNQLQLLAGTCFFLASKVEKSEDTILIAQLCDLACHQFNIAQVKECEIMILNEINFDVNIVTVDSLVYLIMQLEFFKSLGLNILADMIAFADITCCELKLNNFTPLLQACVCIIMGLNAHQLNFQNTIKYFIQQNFIVNYIDFLKCVGIIQKSVTAFLDIPKNPFKNLFLIENPVLVIKKMNLGDVNVLQNCMNNLRHFGVTDNILNHF